MTRRLYEDEVHSDMDWILVLILVEDIIYDLYIVLFNTIVFNYLGMYISSGSSVIAVLDFISCYDKHIILICLYGQYIVGFRYRCINGIYYRIWDV